KGIGCVRMQAAQEQEVEVFQQLVLCAPEPGADLADAWPILGGDPRHHRQDPAQPLGGAHAWHKASNHAVTSSRSSGGPSTSAWSRKPSTKERNASRLVTGTANTTLPSSRRSSTAEGPTWAIAHDAWSPSTSNRPSTAAPSPICHGGGCWRLCSGTTKEPG